MLNDKVNSAQVDDKDYELLSKYDWKLRNKNRNGIIYTYAARIEKGEYILMHREIMGFPKDMLIDHIDHNGLNNTRANLRKATVSQNQRNRRVHINNSCGYKGVYWRKDRSVWISRIYVDKKKIHLGSYPELIDAAKAYDSGAIKYFGEFAWLNFPAEANK